MKTKDVKEEIKKYGVVNFIKGELTKRGMTLKDLTEELGISTTFMYRFLYKGDKSRRVARAIEDFLEVPRGSLFPYLLEPVEKSGEKSKERKGDSENV